METHVHENFRLFVNHGYSPIYKTISCVMGNRIYQETFSPDSLNLNGLPFEKFDLALKSGFETNIYKQIYSSFYITMTYQKVIIHLTLRFRASEINEPRPGEVIVFTSDNEEYEIELPRVEFNFLLTMDAIQSLQENYFRLYQVAIINGLPVVESAMLYDYNPNDESWKNVPIVAFMERIEYLENQLKQLVDVFGMNGRQHIIDEFIFSY